MSSSDHATTAALAGEFSPAAAATARSGRRRKAAHAKPAASAQAGSWLAHPWWTVAAVLIWAALAVIVFAVPDKPAGFVDPLYAHETNLGFAAWAGLLAIAAVAGPLLPALRERLRKAGPWLAALGLLFIAWELTTAKFGLLPVPFFAPPSSLVEVYADDWVRLTDSLLNSLRLLGYGFATGAVAGFITGVSIGWSQSLGYWVHPILRFLGPIPSTALLPMAFFFFPTSFSAAVFLIALATWFPVTVLTWSGVASVDKAYYDVARTLGANERFLVLKVAVPAALPHVFVGLFMGLGASFSVLVVAEMMGVKSGLGWYLQWAQGWAAYSNMYGALIVMAIIFSGLITLLFSIRDRLLAWQKGVVKW